MPSDQFLQEVLLPAAAKDPKGETPMHIGLRYLETFGSTALSTSPFKHKIVGLDAYGKVTSPLRRYGDMILHWQIEAALREEARTGRSLVTDKKVEDVDRRFLPFSANVLNTIIVGLQPREKMISRSKSYSEMFWISQLLFRAHHFGETALPLGKTLRAYVHDDFSGHATFGWGVGCYIMDLNVTGTLMQEVGSQQVTAKMGDVWECEIEQVDCYKRVVILKAVRLLERAEDGPG
ncbi:hypothetical protein B0A55_11190 [Friedmanniomyces simplex]|uniref:Uncharacterized protein n=1 Tax=Friedmanniomyces simplex TaxID=329884 RepID=A0A4U0WP62_9PEZI|nr:hypothetical protein B0A55_11190 [Friedmanniomyces simplex]